MNSRVRREVDLHERENDSTDEGSEQSPGELDERVELVVDVVKLLLSRSSKGVHPVSTVLPFKKVSDRARDTALSISDNRKRRMIAVAVAVLERGHGLQTPDEQDDEQDDEDEHDKGHGFTSQVKVDLSSISVLKRSA